HRSRPAALGLIQPQQRIHMRHEVVQILRRKLTLMRELSPEYLHHFMAHVDALLWLDQAQGGGPAAVGAEVARGAESGKKTGRRQKAVGR
ncbi:MAG: DUF2894 domain-containing protein, partial [Verrucomicrobiaceae bacterium]